MASHWAASRKHVAPNHFTRTFSRSYVTIGVVSVSGISESLQEFRCRRNSPLLVIPYGLQDIRNFLSRLSNGPYMSDAIWLLFLDTNTSLEHFFTDINIPFDCQFLVAQTQRDHVVVLTEVYRVSPTLPLQTYRFGYWTAGGGLTWPSQGLYRRRNNLQGAEMKAGILQGFAAMKKMGVDFSVGDLAGLFMKLWPLLETALNCTVEVYGNEDPEVIAGRMLPDGHWTGFFGMLERREVDVAYMPLTMSSSRLDIMNFVMPVVDMRTQVIIKKPDCFEMQWNAIILPFCMNLWIAVGVAMLVLTVCLATAAWLIRHYMDFEDRYFGLAAAVFIVYSAVCQQAHDDVPKSTSLRTMFVTIYLTGMLLLGCYSAGFITNLTLRDPALPFTDFEGLLKDGSYTLGMALVNEQLEYFKNSSDNVLKEVYAKLVAPYAATFDLDDISGLHRVCYDRKYAHFISLYMLLIPFYVPKCSVTFVPRAYYPGTFTIGTAKNNPYLGILNSKLQQMKHFGIIKREYEHFAFRLRLATQSDDKQKLSVDLYDVTPIFATLALGTAISVALLLVEICTNSFQVFM